MIKPILNASSHGFAHWLRQQVRSGKINKEQAKELINQRSDKELIINILRGVKNV